MHNAIPPVRAQTLHGGPVRVEGFDSLPRFQRWHGGCKGDKPCNLWYKGIRDARCALRERIGQWTRDSARSFWALCELT